MLFKTERVLVKKIKPLTCTLSYCFLEIDLDHSKKAVIKEFVLTSLKAKEQEINSFPRSFKSRRYLLIKKAIELLKVVVPGL